ncbi:class I SAM-dependent methyltransferase [Glycomyces buryatensis]|uniref:Class I SAM-dependent methyltransferase n=1 Tax=Glycomyces buryatensis TaxID=2570927 RepID=A0A4S8Q3L0_9ACTN|nr:class I SAM-dependent methyltransferase [Glycomyces buryatensis]THV37741.1 class I SAM-dependent methyltransferase [Glycomyces buryatensis]
MRPSDRMLLIELAEQVKAMNEGIREIRDQQHATDKRLKAIEHGLERTRKVVRGHSRTAYAQIEDLLALYRELDPGEALPRMRGWAAGPELLRFLCDEVATRERRQVVECGSGTTTVVLAYAMRARGVGAVTALEHDPHYAAETRWELAERNLEMWAEVVDAPLTDVDIAGEPWRWYDLSGLDVNAVDLLLVDGPPGATGPQARYPALPLLAERLVGDATVVMDDANRSDERAIVERWTNEFEGFTVQSLPHERGTAVLRRKA